MRSRTSARRPEVLILSNPLIAPYNVYVQDEMRQAKVHDAWWHNTVQATARNETRTVRNIVRKPVHNAWR